MTLMILLALLFRFFWVAGCIPAALVCRPLEETAPLPLFAISFYGAESATNNTPRSTNHFSPTTKGVGVLQQQRANELVVLERRDLRSTQPENRSRHYRLFDVLEDLKPPRVCQHQ